jgi:hypothetical protein
MELPDTSVKAEKKYLFSSMNSFATLSDGDEWDATTKEDLEFQPFESKKAKGHGTNSIW